MIQFGSYPTFGSFTVPQQTPTPSLFLFTQCIGYRISFWRVRIHTPTVAVEFFGGNRDIPPAYLRTFHILVVCDSERLKSDNAFCCHIIDEISGSDPMHRHPNRWT